MGKAKVLINKTAIVILFVFFVIFNIILCYRCGLLQFREEASEVHVKIGGDHGGKSFKACYEICNIPRPNSKNNTIIFSLFEAKDYRSNLRAGLAKFQDHKENKKLHIRC